MFAYVIILLQFSELFAWRDGLYLKYIGASKLFAESYFIVSVQVKFRYLWLLFTADLAVSDL